MEGVLGITIYQIFVTGRGLFFFRTLPSFTIGYLSIHFAYQLMNPVRNDQQPISKLSLCQKTLQVTWILDNNISISWLSCPGPPEMSPCVTGGFQKVRSPSYSCMSQAGGGGGYVWTQLCEHTTVFLGGRKTRKTWAG